MGLVAWRPKYQLLLLWVETTGNMFTDSRTIFALRWPLTDFNPEMTFLDWHVNTCQRWNHSKPLAALAWIWSPQHAADQVAQNFWGLFLLRLLCATGCYGRTFDTSRRGWFDQRGAKDASVAWPILFFGTRVQSGKELGNPNPHWYDVRPPR
jgi:hypothetical protein